MSITPEQYAQLVKELAEAKALNAKLNAQASSTRLSFRVSEKGAVSVYGMGRFPVTLYGEQWEKLFAVQDEIKSFMEANKAKLATKDKTETVKEVKEESKPSESSTVPAAIVNQVKSGVVPFGAKVQ